MNDTKETIFFLEGRGGSFLYHFIIYNLGGLYHILNSEYNIRGADSVKWNNNNIVDIPTNIITFPIKIFMNDILPFQREAFEIIKDKFVLIEDLSNIENYEIISIYGTVINLATSEIMNKNIIYFLRALFLEKINYPLIPKKNIFISRSQNISIHSHNKLKRCLLNIDEFTQLLNKYNFDIIKLEEYNFHDKIKLFMSSDLIISTNGSQLTPLLFSNSNSKIIEIVNNGDGNAVDIYKSIANMFHLNYNRYSNICEDSDGNFTLNIDAFEKYLLPFI
jgi:hypothetical protein